MTDLDEPIDGKDGFLEDEVLGDEPLSSHEYEDEEITLAEREIIETYEDIDLSDPDLEEFKEEEMNQYVGRV